MPESLQPPFPDRLACVIFDIDGTLARTHKLIFASFNHVARKYLSKGLSDREILALFGPPEDGGLRKLLQRDDVDGPMDDLCSFYRENHGRMAGLHGGIREVLSFLTESGVRLAVFTGKGRQTTQITLEELGINRFFEVVVTGSDIIRHKPNPEGILFALESLGVDSDGALMVGDSLSDLRASRAAGVKTASVFWDAYDRESVLRAEPEFCFDTVGHLHLWLRDQVLRNGDPSGTTQGRTI